jgi:hypothetical protein
MPGTGHVLELGEYLFHGAEERLPHSRMDDSDPSE